MPSKKLKWEEIKHEVIDSTRYERRKKFALAP
jgi:hypothetical protein